MMDVPYISVDAVPQGGIVIASEISPADAVFLDPKRYAGLATVHGGAAGHTAVIACRPCISLGFMKAERFSEAD